MADFTSVPTVDLLTRAAHRLAPGGFCEDCWQTAKDQSDDDGGLSAAAYYDSSYRCRHGRTPR